MIPGFSSFFITELKSDLTALGEATMPQLVLLNTPMQSGHWFMYDFGTTNGKKWKVVVDKCRYVIQQLDDLPVYAIKYLDLGSTLSFSFRVTPVNVGKVSKILHLSICIFLFPEQPMEYEGSRTDGQTYCLRISYNFL